MWKYNELYHHGILGQKWGVRRFQNEDGTLTSAGKKRYSGEASDADSVSTKRDKKLEKAQKEYDKTLSKNYYKIHNAAARYANEVLIPQINAEFEGRYDSPDYMKEYERRFNEAVGRAAVEMYGPRPEYSGEVSDVGSVSKKRDKKLEKAQKKYDKTLSKNYYKIYNAAADYANEVLIPQINAEFEGRYDSPDYMKEYERRFNEAMGRAAVELFGSRPA